MSSDGVVIPPELLNDAAKWPELKRWERRELGQDLRRQGLSYKEIRAVIPVSKGTLSGWCFDIWLSEDQLRRIQASRGNNAAAREKVGAILRQRNQERVQAVREAGRQEAQQLSRDPFWAAGVSAYWSEGHKRDNSLGFTNSDPGLIRLFLEWAKRFLRLTADRFTIRLHLHAGQDELECKKHWSDITGIPLNRFGKTFVKREGTGHRKNILYNGTATIEVTRSTDLFHRVMGWIDFVKERWCQLG